MPQNNSKVKPGGVTPATKLKSKSNSLAAGLQSLANPGKSLQGLVKPKGRATMTVEGVVDASDGKFPTIPAKQPQLPIDDPFKGRRVSQT